VAEYDLKRVDRDVKSNKPVLLLKNVKEDSVETDALPQIQVDRVTVLEIPEEALEYEVGCYNPLRWILEFYKESKNHIGKNSSDDEGVRRKFSTYKFDDHKEEAIVLLRKVTTVCLETVKLRKELEGLEWGEQPKIKLTKLTKNKTNGRKSSSSKPTRTRKKTKSQNALGTGQERLF